MDAGKCQCLTLKGKQCKNSVKDDNIYCYLHKLCASPVLQVQPGTMPVPAPAPVKLKPAQPIQPIHPQPVQVTAVKPVPVPAAAKPKTAQKVQVKQRQQARPRVINPVHPFVAAACENCLKEVNMRSARLAVNKGKEYLVWDKIRLNCQGCVDRILGQMEDDLKDNYMDRPYPRRVLSSTPVTLDHLKTSGSENGYYNDTMMRGAKYWVDKAVERQFPSVPK